MALLSSAENVGTRVDGIRRFLSRITAERVLWLVMVVVIFGIAIVPLLYVVNAAFLEETPVGLSANRSIAAIVEVYTSAAYIGFLAQALILSAVVVALALPYGIILAFLVARTDIARKGLIDFLIVMPLFLSPFTGLIAWVGLGSSKSGFINVAIDAVLQKIGVEPVVLIDVWSYAGIVWVMFLFFCPLAYLFMVGNLRAMDSTLEEAARMVGANPLQTILRVTLPISLPSILASGLLIFVHAAEIYTIPGMLGSNSGFTTLPWRIYQDSTSYPVKFAHAAAAGTMLLWVTIIGVAVQRRLTRHAERFTTVTGKGFKAQPIRLKRWRVPALLFITLFILAADVFPFASLIIFSFMKYTSSVITADILTLQQYEVLLSLQNTRGALWNTIWLAVVSGAVCVLIGLFVSYNDVRRPSVATRVVAFMGILPIAVPGILYGVGLLWTFLRTPLYGTTWVLLFAYIAKSIPYSILVSRSAVQQVHPDLEQSARLSGATSLVALRAITMPLLMPTLMAILIFVMLSSIKELSASVLLYTRRSQVLSVLTWQYMDSGDYQFAAAIAVVQTIMIACLIFVTNRLFKVQLEQTYGKT